MQRNWEDLTIEILSEGSTAACWSLLPFDSHLQQACGKKKEIARAIYFKMKSKIFKSHKVVSNCDLLKVTKITNTNPQAQITLGPKRNTLNAKRKIRKDQTLVQGWYMD